MKSISFTDRAKLLAREIKEAKSFEVTLDGELLYIAVIPKTPYEREAVRKLADMGNNVHGGKDI